MKIRLAAVGRLKESYWREALSEYAKRLTRFCEFSVIEVAESPCARDPSEPEIRRVREEEGGRLLAKCEGFVVALDMSGTQPDSLRFAEFIRARESRGSRLSFVIGGSYGLSPAVLQRADLVLSFGKMTFPHQLMRVLFSEQLYRAFMICSNGAYHK